MKLWLDDVRPPPDGTWAWVKNVEDAKQAFLINSNITEASLDHDLGFLADANWDGDPREPIEIEANPEAGPDGIDLAKWLCENKLFPTECVTIHSWNPVGARNMANALYDGGCPCPIIIDPFKIKEQKCT